MADMKKAIELEQFYIECRMKGEYPFHLADKIMECGFESLEQFHNEKLNYLVGSLPLEYIEKEPKDSIAEVLRMIEKKVVGVLFVDTDETFVFNGTSNKGFNEPYCIDNNIPIYPIYSSGGTIVSVKGDFSFGLCVPRNIIEDNTDFVLCNVKQILDKYANNVEINNNDILIDGKKVLGSTVYEMNDVCMWVGHFAFADSTELIKNICPQSEKVPSHIVDVSREQFKQEVLEWLRIIP